jgi:Flp pilus assembly protein TadB
MNPLIALSALGWILFSMSAARIFELGSRERSLFAPVSFFAGTLLVSVAPRFLSPVVLLCLIGILGASLRPLAEFFRRFLDEKDRKSLPALLDELVLTMKAGRSLRFALIEVSGRTNERLGRVLREISARLEHGASVEGMRGLSLELMREMARIHRSNVKVVDQVASFRRICRVRENFRRKSGQVTAQTRAQAAISFLLFAPLVGFHFHQSDEPWNARLALALGLFLAAQAWIHFGSRRVRWTV